MNAAETAIVGNSSSISDLTTRVTTLETEPQSATIVLDNVTFD